MSFDVSVEKACGCGSINYNITYNVSPMFYLALDSEDGLRGLNELKCSEAIPKLQRAIEYFDNHWADMMSLNPKNGWGSADGARELLSDLLRDCFRYPDSTIIVS